MAEPEVNNVEIGRTASAVLVRIPVITWGEGSSGVIRGPSIGCAVSGTDIIVPLPFLTYGEIVEKSFKPGASNASKRAEVAMFQDPQYSSLRAMPPKIISIGGSTDSPIIRQQGIPGPTLSEAMNFLVNRNTLSSEDILITMAICLIEVGYAAEEYARYGFYHADAAAHNAIIGLDKKYGVFIDRETVRKLTNPEKGTSSLTEAQKNDYIKFFLLRNILKYKLLKAGPEYRAQFWNNQGAFFHDIQAQYTFDPSLLSEVTRISAQGEDGIDFEKAILFGENFGPQFFSEIIGYNPRLAEMALDFMQRELLTPSSRESHSPAERFARYILTRLQNLNLGRGDLLLNYPMLRDTYLERLRIDYTKEQLVKYLKGHISDESLDLLTSDAHIQEMIRIIKQEAKTRQASL